MPARKERAENQTFRELVASQGLLIIALIGIVLCDSNIFAKEKSISGTWTLTVEQHFGLKLVLEQKNTVVTGTLDWPHGDPIKLVGALKGDTLTFAGDSRARISPCTSIRRERSRRTARWPGRSQRGSSISTKRTRSSESTIRRFHGQPSGGARDRPLRPLGGRALDDFVKASIRGVSKRITWAGAKRAR